jgi:hypothetical protein
VKSKVNKQKLKGKVLEADIGVVQGFLSHQTPNLERSQSDAKKSI